MIQDRKHLAILIITTAVYIITLSLFAIWITDRFYKIQEITNQGTWEILDDIFTWKDHKLVISSAFCLCFWIVPLGLLFKFEWALKLATVFAVLGIALAANMIFWVFSEPGVLIHLKQGKNLGLLFRSIFAVLVSVASLAILYYSLTLRFGSSNAESDAGESLPNAR